MPGSSRTAAGPRSPGRDGPGCPPRRACPSIRSGDCRCGAPDGAHRGNSRGRARSGRCRVPMPRTARDTPRAGGDHRHAPRSRWRARGRHRRHPSDSPRVAGRRCARGSRPRPAPSRHPRRWRGRVATTQQRDAAAGRHRRAARGGRSLRRARAMGPPARIDSPCAGWTTRVVAPAASRRRCR